ncbi:MAG: hypothetical protein ABFR33_02525 [Verrucomicrobiota bacterium]
MLRYRSKHGPPFEPIAANLDSVKQELLLALHGDGAAPGRRGFSR